MFRLFKILKEIFSDTKEEINCHQFFWLSSNELLKTIKRGFHEN